MWLLVPLGNPGTAYTATRHNLGRLLYMRWMKTKYTNTPKIVYRLNHGNIYSLYNSVQVLIPKTYMNLSGLACLEAIKIGYDFKRMVIVYDDKDLPLGSGRFRISGSAGGHNGLRSIFEQLKCHNIPRLRLGTGPFTRPLVDFVLEKWTKSEWDHVVKMDGFFSNFMDLLHNTEDLELLMNTINSATFWPNSR